MDTPNNSIVEKIKKLLAIANDTAASDNEVSNAMKLVNDLLLKHNLTLGNIDTSNDESKIKNLFKSEKIVFGEVVEESNWEVALITTLCEYNLCKPIIHTTTGLKGGHITILGNPLNIECVNYMFQVARKLYRQLSKARYNELRKEVLIQYRAFNQSENDALRAKDLPYRMPWIRNYLKGCVSGLYIKLEQQKRALSSDTQALIVVNNEALELFATQSFDDLRDRHFNKSATDDSAFNLGKQDALENDLTLAIDGADSDPTQNLLNQTLKLNEVN